jgi:hypothetical protein
MEARGKRPYSPKDNFYTRPDRGVCYCKHCHEPVEWRMVRHFKLKTTNCGAVLAGEFVGTFHPFCVTCDSDESFLTFEATLEPIRE